MAKKRKGPNKSAAIRAFYEGNPEAKPKEVADALKAQGIIVNPQFVSTIRSKHVHGDATPKKRVGRPKGTTKKTVSKAGTARRGRPPKAPSAGTANMSLADLLKAKEMINELGGIEKARASIDAIDQLSD